MHDAKILCINPWIYDFAAYDFWSKPLGLLYIAALLRQHGLDVDFIDCLDRWHPELLQRQKRSRPKRRKGGIGPFHREIVEKPQCLQFMPRHFARYGLPESIFIEDLKNRNQPEVILVTSIMTYWYPGVKKVVELCRRIFPGVPVVLGGIYATLMPDHARETIAPDYLLTGPAEEGLLPLLGHLLKRPKLENNLPTSFDSYPFPAWDLLHGLDYLVMMATRGCPLSCSFCATNNLSGYSLRQPEKVVQEMQQQTKKYGVSQIAFYDDALFMQAENHIKPLLRDIISRKTDISLHAPNGLHARFIDEELAELMFRARFRTIRLSLESVAKERQRDIHNKITPGEMTRAVRRLVRAGFKPKDLETYIIMALPGQKIEEVVETIGYAHSLGVRVRLCSYSPIPGTKDYNRAIAAGNFPENADPLLTNKTVIPLCRTTAAYTRYEKISQFAHWLNERAWGEKQVTEENAKRIFRKKFSV
ncbi:MAG: radical SAM protein [Calditrichaeota bacterium]|nr:MAG: radical SAM protein [Calditrichota bacterium]